MDTTIESRLIEALDAEARAVPAAAEERLRHVDYRPRRSFVSARRIAAAGGVVGVAAATTAGVLLSSATPAFAGWSSAPAKATAAQLAASDSICLPLFGALPGTSWASVSSDVRGPFTLVVYEDTEQDYATCLSGGFLLAQAAIISGPAAGETLSAAANFGPQPTFVRNTQTPGPGGLETLTDDQYKTLSNENYSLVDAQVASDVSTVTLNLSDGTSVDTTVGGGWLVAWWPGDTAAVSASVTTPSGTTTVSLGPPSSHQRARR
ncbi:MAG TPA: hypothetical protein VGS21_03720 [Acidimicrobiales bacterium]|nr:hypothetical protein [Acidimicrobiales bacterium]